jgi:toxin ParE1/3/4
MHSKSFKVYWTRSAQLDLLEIVDYIKTDSKNNARDIFQKIKSKSLELNMMPMRGRVVPEFREFNIDKYRELLISPWRIIYLIDNHSVYILGVVDSRRDIEELLFKKVMQVTGLKSIP